MESERAAVGAKEAAARRTKSAYQPPDRSYRNGPTVPHGHARMNAASIKAGAGILA